MEPDPTVVQRPRATVTKGTLARIIAISAAATVLGIVVALSINWFPVAASTQAGPIDTLWYVLLIVSVPIFVIVCAVILTSIIKFRMRPGEEDLDGPPIHGNTKLEVVWTTIPALLLLGLCTYAYLVLHDIEKAPAKGATNAPEIRVQVTGQQFNWTFAYETDARGNDVAPKKQVQTAQLFLPEGQSIKFDVVSRDVLHDFWVPAFRMKIDAVPGIITHIRVTPRKVGSYPIVCAELCGLGHAFMRNTAHVMDKQAFATWLRRHSALQSAAGGPAAGGPAAPPPSTTAATPAMIAAGKTVFTGASGCSGCHTLADAGANGQIGPDLDKVLANRDQKFIQTSIVDPNAFIEKGFTKGVMPPNFGTMLSKDDLSNVVAYLYSVTHK